MESGSDDDEWWETVGNVCEWRCLPDMKWFEPWMGEREEGFRAIPHQRRRMMYNWLHERRRRRRRIQ